MSRRDVAVVVPGLEVPGSEPTGGAKTIARFVYRVLEGSARYRPRLISLATSSRDPASVRFVDPRTWVRGVQVRPGTWRGIPFRHVGARGVELESQRYRPRPTLTDLLDEVDLVKVVAGAPVWAGVATRTRTPVVLETATTVDTERRAIGHSESRTLKDRWRALFTPLLRTMGRRALDRVERVFVINARMEEEMGRRVGADRVHFATPGVDTDRFRPPEEEPDGDYLLSVGRFADPRKDPITLFKAYARLRRSVSNAPGLVLAGASTPNEKALEVMRSLDLSPHVEIRENVPGDELVELYRRASFFVLSSRQEGLGMVVLEAMACGRAVVSTDCIGPRTVMEHEETGLLTPVGDPAALAGAMETLIRNPAARRAMGRRARTRAVEDFSREVAGDRLLGVYDDVLG